MSLMQPFWRWDYCLMKKLLMTTASLLVALGTATTASADSQSFIDYLNNNGGRPAFTFADGPLINQGYNFCNMIRGGMPVDQVKAMNFGPTVNTPLFVDAAQHELCPDTL